MIKKVDLVENIGSPARPKPSAKEGTEIPNLKTAKEPDKNIGSNCILILGKENF